MNTKLDALNAMRSIQSGTLAGHLLDLYRRAYRRELVDQAGEALDTLTDYEAAAWLSAELGYSVERTSINAARGLLVKRQLVEAGVKRRCRFKPTRHKVVGWRLREGLGPVTFERAEPSPMPDRGPQPTLFSGAAAPPPPTHLRHG